MKKLIISCLSVIICLGITQTVSAQENEGRWINSNDYEPNPVIMSMDKLGRGVENTLLGVFEIPKQSMKRAIDTDSSYGYISGLFIGIGFFVLRELAGVYEIVTFPFPIPSNYDPIMDPILGYEPIKILN